MFPIVLIVYGCRWEAGLYELIMKNLTFFRLLFVLSLRPLRPLRLCVYQCLKHY